MPISERCWRVAEHGVFRNRQHGTGSKLVNRLSHALARRWRRLRSPLDSQHDEVDAVFSRKGWNDSARIPEEHMPVNRVSWVPRE